MRYEENWCRRSSLGNDDSVAKLEEAWVDVNRVWTSGVIVIQDLKFSSRCLELWLVRYEPLERTLLALEFEPRLIPDRLLELLVILFSCVCVCLAMYRAYSDTASDGCCRLLQWWANSSWAAMMRVYWDASSKPDGCWGPREDESEPILWCLNDLYFNRDFEYLNPARGESSRSRYW
jgi:hypothetical protein